MLRDTTWVCRVVLLKTFKWNVGTNISSPFTLCSSQFPTSKRDHDTWQARGYNERTTAIRLTTECLRHPTSNQAPNRSGLT